MLQDLTPIEKKFDLFIEAVCASEVVWGLKKGKDIATLPSINFEDNQGKPINLICFWSEKTMAESCTLKEWENYQAFDIPLGDFIENWCLSMANDHVIAGINVDMDQIGFEIEPVSLILELCTELALRNKSVPLKKMKDTIALMHTIKNIIDREENGS